MKSEAPDDLGKVLASALNAGDAAGRGFRRAQEGRHAGVRMAAVTAMRAMLSLADVL